ncbi:hypothetical protein EVAR_27321_1 [Eumeta japonica]|uniref:Uncharacterized protein n=1 Tax=Eumeta variegata TaxID=151549 RepID=A0A4C1UD93_EUMVA|nr:hypothetical protein EVAR_27321_1 [Eumeta japonica]
MRVNSAKQRGRRAGGITVYVLFSNYPETVSSPLSNLGCHLNIDVTSSWSAYKLLFEAVKRVNGKSQEQAQTSLTLGPHDDALVVMETLRDQTAYEQGEFVIFERLSNEYRRSFVQWNWRACNGVLNDPYIGQSLARGLGNKTCPYPAENPNGTSNGPCLCAGSFRYVVCMSETWPNFERRNNNLRTLCIQRAHDRLKTNDLSRTLSMQGIIIGLAQALKSLYKGSSARVRINKAYADWFNRGVRQGCVVSTYLFNLFMDNYLYDLKKYDCGSRMDALSVKCLLYTDG